MKTYFATKYTAPQSLKVFLILLFVLPILFASVRIIRDRVLIATSVAIVVFYSRGNGGIGASKLFAFAIDGKKCKQFDLGIELGLDKLVPKDMAEVDTHMGPVRLGNYQVLIEEEDITIQTGDQKILQYDAYKHGYFNIGVEEAYWKQK